MENVTIPPDAVAMARRALAIIATSERNYPPAMAACEEGETILNGTSRRTVRFRGGRTLHVDVYGGNNTHQQIWQFQISPTFVYVEIREEWTYGGVKAADLIYESKDPDPNHRALIAAQFIETLSHPETLIDPPQVVPAPDEPLP